MADITDITNTLGYTAQIKDGKVASSVSKVNKDTGKIESDKISETAGGELDKDAFLQLLVAQMKYQDPLEPTDNTEYVSQLASFSSLEQMQNMNEAMSTMSVASELQRATNLVGQYASVDVKGNTITGKVDSVEYKDGTAYLSIEGNSYPLSSLKESIDSVYLAATELAKQFDTILASLPPMEAFNDSYESKVTNLREAYNAMDMYQQTFISKDSLGKLAVYEQALAKIKEAKEAEEAGETKADSENVIESTDPVVSKEA